MDIPFFPPIEIPWGAGYSAKSFDPELPELPLLSLLTLLLSFDKLPLVLVLVLDLPLVEILVGVNGSAVVPAAVAVVAALVVG